MGSESNEKDCVDDCEIPIPAVANVTGRSALWTVTPTGDGQSSYLDNNANRLVVNDEDPGSGTWMHMVGPGDATRDQARWQVRYRRMPAQEVSH